MYVPLINNKHSMCIIVGKMISSKGKIYNKLNLGMCVVKLIAGSMKLSYNLKSENITKFYGIN